MNRRLVFPLAAFTAWAQQSTPAPSPAQSAAEKALKARVDQFYQLMMEKKYRAAEDMVAADSKDEYYNGPKPDIKGFSIQKVEFSDRARKATVTVQWKLQTLFPGLGVTSFDIPATTWWKLEKGKWDWYIDREARRQTPFGVMKSDGSVEGSLDTAKGRAPDLAVLQNGVSIDRPVVTLSEASPSAVLTVTNSLPGPAHLSVDELLKLEGVKVEIEPADLNSGEKASVRITLETNKKISGKVGVEVLPINKVLEVEVNGN